MSDHVVIIVIFLDDDDDDGVHDDDYDDYDDRKRRHFVDVVINDASPIDKRSRRRHRCRRWWWIGGVGRRVDGGRTDAGICVDVETRISRFPRLGDDVDGEQLCFRRCRCFQRKGTTLQRRKSLRRRHSAGGSLRK